MVTGTWRKGGSQGAEGGREGGREGGWGGRAGGREGGRAGGEVRPPKGVNGHRSLNPTPYALHPTP
jgi:hypothetical protein